MGRGPRSPRLRRDGRVGRRGAPSSEGSAPAMSSTSSVMRGARSSGTPTTSSRGGVAGAGCRGRPGSSARPTTGTARAGSRCRRAAHGTGSGGGPGRARRRGCRRRRSGGRAAGGARRTARPGWPGSSPPAGSRAGAGRQVDAHAEAAPLRRQLVDEDPRPVVGAAQDGRGHAVAVDGERHDVRARPRGRPRPAGGPRPAPIGRVPGSVSAAVRGPEAWCRIRRSPSWASSSRARSRSGGDAPRVGRLVDRGVDRAQAAPVRRNLGVAAAGQPLQPRAGASRRCRRRGRRASEPWTGR